MERPPGNVTPRPPGLGLAAYPRDFKLLLIAQFLAQGADGLAQAAFADILVLEPSSQGTPGKILALFAITLVPYSLLAPFLGVFVDRWDRRKLLAGTNLARVVLLVSTALWARAFTGDTALFIAVLVMQGFGRLFLATKGAVLPVVLHEHDLVRGNALSGAGGTLSAVTGGAIGLGISGLIGAEATLTIAGALYIVPFFASLKIATKMTHPHERVATLWGRITDIARDLWDGAVQITARPRARIPLIAIFVLRSAGILIAVQIILLIKQDFTSEDDHFGRIGLSGLSLGAAGLGALVAALTAPRIDRRIATARVMLLGFVVVAASLLFFGRAGSVPELLALAGLSGAGGFYCKVAVDAQVQGALPDIYRGRAFSIYDILYNLASVVGGGVVVIFQGSEISTTLTVAGAFVLALGGLAYVEMRRVRML